MAAASWGVLYAAVEVAWAAAGITVPWKEHASFAPAVQLLLAALAVLASGACLASTRTLAKPGRAAVATALIVTIPVFVVGTNGLPIYFVTLVTLSGIESATGLAQVLLNTLGAALLLLVGLSYRRRLRGDCPRCGQPHTGTSDGPLAHPAVSPPPKRTRKAVYLLMCGLLPWAGVKSIWTLGGNALGVSGVDWQKTTSVGASGPSKAAAAAGIDVTVLAAMVGVFLLLGLLHAWGQVFPRWTLILSGRRVPRLLPLIPAWLTGIPLTMYGAVLTIMAPLIAVGVLPEIKPSPPFTTSSGITWMVEFGGLAFAGLGIGLVVAARSYAARTRPVCASATARNRPE
ncbi:hypothetical protein J2Z21_009658 [Streptomyces griseochromogenes]|uniref:D-alanyl-D-alanine dipeptidase n=1 Tax=Streptomyces griseochromogenes TaxID=68214 RepID=A0ABS4MAE6_9ACTN|nr:hypothetical protein [Streptomyces griseochromogenes]MBP2056639.1 hypothetical protein [Streptomyces griseochromogenes]